jgi:hypothetical protein
LFFGFLCILWVFLGGTSVSSSNKIVQITDSVERIRYERGNEKKARTDNTIVNRK